MEILQNVFRSIAWLGWPVTLVTMIIENESCSSTLFNDNFLDAKCLSLAVSKALSYAMILGSCFYKIPVVMKIIDKKGGDGLSMLGLYLETSAFISSFLYSYFRQLPFSTYGDLCAVILANLVIIVLVWRWGKNGEKFSVLHMLSMLVAGSLFVSAHWAMPPQLWHFIGSYATVVLTVSRLPQIISNATTGDVGVQSAVTIFNAALGSFAKIFVVVVETKDPVLMAGSGIGFLCNFILLCQVSFMKPVAVGSPAKASEAESSSQQASTTATGSVTKPSRRPTKTALEQ